MLETNGISWLQVWEKKGRDAGGKSVWEIDDLLKADGFDGVMAQTGEAARRHIAELITKSLAIRRGMRILEVGCGAGAALAMLRHSGAVFAGVDYSSPHIEIARAAMPEMDFRVSEAAALPFTDGSFDGAFSYGVFLYFPDVQYASEVLRELLRVVRAGARILIQDVPDAAKRTECEAARKAAGAALNPPHCYYPKDFFERFAAASGRYAKIED
jgi:ubiquinone/menaquinone biosynthesis C-methylase UbiE